MINISCVILSLVDACSMPAFSDFGCNGGKLPRRRYWLTTSVTRVQLQTSAASKSSIPVCAVMGTGESRCVLAVAFGLKLGCPRFSQLAIVADRDF